ncbi:MAG: globin [Planctomycetaceae bacterium]
MLDESEISSVCSAIGEEGIVRVVAAFYRQIPTDDLLGPLYPPQDLVEAEARLRDFLIYRFGGSERYLELRGHPRLRQRHAPFSISQSVRDRWVALMDHALTEAELPASAVAIMQAFLHHTASFLINT